MAAVDPDAEAPGRRAQRLFDVYHGLQAEVLADRDERVAAANRLKTKLDRLHRALRQKQEAA